MLGPEETDFGLLRCTDGAIESAERHHLIVIIDPYFAIESVGTFVREKLRGAGHCERHHLPEPRCDGGRVGNVGEQAVVEIRACAACSPTAVPAEITTFCAWTPVLAKRIIARAVTGTRR